MVGKWYDYLYILGIMLKRKEWKNPHALICTEVVVMLLSVLGKVGEDAAVKPNELYRHLKSLRVS
jgi:hypothetical protein